MSSRRFGEYRFGDVAETRPYGDVYIGESGSRRQRVRITVVASDLAHDSAYRDALLHYGRAFSLLRHEHLIGVLEVGAEGDDLVVVEEYVEDAITLDDVIRDIGDSLDPAVALSLASGLIGVLSYLHSVGLVVGFIGPESVCIDSAGFVRLSDCALARALAAAGVEQPERLQRFQKLVAPELLAGKEVTPRSDVFSVAACIARLPSASATLAGVIDRARTEDMRQRPEDAVALEEEWLEAVQRTESKLALPREVAAAVHSLRGPVPATESPNLDDILSELEEVDGAATHNQLVGAVSGRNAAVAPAARESAGVRRARERVEGVEIRPEAVEPEVGELTDIDDKTIDEETGGDGAELRDGEAKSRALSEERRKADEAAAAAAIADLLPSAPAAAGDPTVSTESAGPVGVPESTGDGKRGDSPLATPALTPAPVRAQSPPWVDPQAVAAISETFVDEVDTEAPDRRGLGYVLPVIAVLAAGFAFGFIYFGTDAFHPDRARAKADRSERDRIAKERELRAQQKRPGTINIRSPIADAAVWLQLGRTPLTTFALPASSSNDLRFEYEGYQSLDIAVVGPMWVGDGASLRAAAHARLEKSAEPKPLPAYPPPPENSPPRGPDGQGPVQVESTPSGATVWLLVGFTPEVELSGFEAGQSYELRVVKDKYSPATVQIRDSDWYLSGEAGVGKLRPELSREVALDKAPRKASRR